MLVAFIIALIIYVLRKYFNSPKTPLSKDMSGKTVIVTGSNTGIGKTAALDLLEKGAKVIFACRDEEKTNTVINSIKDKSLNQNAYYIKLDLGNFESIVNFANEFKRNFNSLDILINNAGATFDAFSRKNNIESTIMVNHIGPVCLTAMLLDCLNAEGKIINVSSRGHRHVTTKLLSYLYTDENFSNMESDYRHLPLYCLSKAGNIYHALHLNEYFKRNHMSIKTASLHPGLVNTEIFSVNRFSKWYVKLLFFIFIPFLWLLSKDVNMGAQTTLHIAYMNYSDLNSGAYFNHCAEEKIPEINTNPDKMTEFMEFTNRMIMKNNKNPPQEIIKYFSN
jgi:NAD(P)-dependent dehydrogenase (short-subunit alcohol dehydrogenase family)